MEEKKQADEKVEVVEVWPKAPIAFSELRNFIEEQIQHKCASYDEIYKNYYLDSSDRAIQLRKDKEEWKTNLKTPITLMFVDKVANVLTKAKGTFTVTDLFSEDRGEDGDQITTEMLDLMDKSLKEPKTKHTLNDIIKDLSCIWQGIVKITYKDSVKKSSYIDFKWKNVDVTKIDSWVILDYVSPYNFFPYYHTNNLEDAAFIAERMLMKRESIEKLLTLNNLTVDRTKLEEAYQYISDKDFNAIKNNIPFYGYNMKDHTTTKIDDWYRIDEKKKMYEVIELQTPTHTRLYINGVEAWPYQGKEQRLMFGYRYAQVHYRKMAGSISALGVGHYIKPLQVEFDTITNLRMDNVKLAVNKVAVVANNVNLGKNWDKLVIWPWKTIKVDNPWDIDILNFGEIPWSSYRETDNIFSFAQWVSWVTGMQLGLQNKVERVAGSSEMLRDALDDQLIEPSDSISALRSWFFKNAMVLTLAYMPENHLDNILGKWNKFKSLEIDNLINDYEFSFETDTESVKNNAVVIQLAMNYLQTTMGMVDANWAPIVDSKSIANFIREKLWLPMNLDLTADDLVAKPQGDVTDALADWWGTWLEELRQLQTMWGTGSALWELGTNPTGVNLSQ